MKSNTAAATSTATSTATLPRYKEYEDKNTWNVKRDAYNDDTFRIITDYYHQENTSYMKSNENQYIQKAFPRHHALILSAMGSASKLASPTTMTSRTLTLTKMNNATARARTRIHNPRHVTHFTEISSKNQKDHLTALSGITGLLVKRLLGGVLHASTSNASVKPAKKYTEIMNRYIHSALACEQLIGYRYYYNLKSMRYNGPIGNKNIFRIGGLAEQDMTEHAIKTTRAELCELYNANIDRLLKLVQSYKHGYVNINRIREDPAFVKMFTVFWHYNHQVSRLMFDFETYVKVNCPSRIEKIDAARIAILYNIPEMVALVPRLYNYDIVHLFDCEIQSFANFVKTIKHKMLTFAYDGFIAAFLSFAAVEPRMVTEDYAPKLGWRKNRTFQLQDCINYIPSRDPIYGALRVKHLAHIPRTADTTMYFRFIGRTDPNYSPIRLMIEHIQTSRYSVSNSALQKEFPETHVNTKSPAYIDKKQPHKYDDDDDDDFDYYSDSDCYYDSD
jgi:hypothetical protein